MYVRIGKIGSMKTTNFDEKKRKLFKIVKGKKLNMYFLVEHVSCHVKGCVIFEFDSLRCC